VNGNLPDGVTDYDIDRSQDDEPVGEYDADALFEAHRDLYGVDYVDEEES